MISGESDRRRRQLAWSTFASLAFHLVVATLLAAALLRYLHSAPARREQISQTTVVSIDKIEPSPTPTPEPTPKPTPTPVTFGLQAGSQQPKAAIAPPQQHAPPKPESKLATDERAFANEVARLNAQNDPHAIPTIDPAQQSGVVKHYGFMVPSGSDNGNGGNGIITTTQSWHDRGQDCYYGRYSFVYGDGSTESGQIVWPFCYDPGADPFHQGRHEIPFPPPLPGYRVPPGTDLPPLEKDFYEHWMSEQ